MKYQTARNDTDITKLPPAFVELLHSGASLEKAVRTWLALGANQAEGQNTSVIENCSGHLITNVSVEHRGDADSDERVDDESSEADDLECIVDEDTGRSVVFITGVMDENPTELEGVYLHFRDYDEKIGDVFLNLADIRKDFKQIPRLPDTLTKGDCSLEDHDAFWKLLDARFNAQVVNQLPVPRVSIENAIVLAIAYALTLGGEASVNAWNHPEYDEEVKTQSEPGYKSLAICDYSFINNERRRAINSFYICDYA